MSPFNSQYKTKRLRKESRTIPLPGSEKRGDGLDFGRYFRCWHCGFICNVDRDALGGDQSITGTGYIYVDTPASGVTPVSGTPAQNSITTISLLESTQISLNVGADGTTEAISQEIASDISGGCPLCGSRNWRGDY